MTIDQGLTGISSSEIVELPRVAVNQRHFVLRSETILHSLLDWANKQGYYLCDLVATDDRLLIDRTFKLHFILSSGARNADELVILEYFVPDPQRAIYASVADIFPNAAPLEQEIHDLFGLVATSSDQARFQPGFLLHPEAYPLEFFPLRRRRTLNALRDLLAPFSPSDDIPPAITNLREGMFEVPVGPIHAGVIEAGHFRFSGGGEMTEALSLRLGYKHRGIEKLFETHRTLQDGSALAEIVSGDSAVAHSIAYCQAVEDLAQKSVPTAVHQWRALFLELERIYNHISDMGLLATGVAYERVAAPLATLRELLVHFVNQPLSGNRFLRGLSYPGGVRPPGLDILSQIGSHLGVIVQEALQLGKEVLEESTCRARMLETGVLTRAEARYATGLAARASGWIEHDFRRRHPSPAYASPEIRKCLDETITGEDKPSSRLAPIYLHDLKGDVFARLAIRVAETETSLYLVKQLIRALQNQKAPISQPGALELRWDSIPEMAMGIGYAEGWRGDVMYAVFKGPGNTMARCKIRDPSTFNWHVFPKAVAKNILADFPLINKSFNLSYAGHDK